MGSANKRGFHILYILQEWTIVNLNSGVRSFFSFLLTLRAPLRRTVDKNWPFWEETPITSTGKAGKTMTSVPRWKLKVKFLLAIRSGDVSTCRTLLNAGLDPDLTFQLAGGLRPALCVAVESGHVDIVELLCDAGAGTNIKDADTGAAPLQIAACRGLGQVVNVLLRHGARPGDVNTRGETGLHLAAKHGQLEAATALVERAGLDIDIRDEEGRTALMSASLGGHVEVARMMVSYGADLTLVDKHGNTALVLATVAPKITTQLVKVLSGGEHLGEKSKQSMVNKVNQLGDAAIHNMVRRGVGVDCLQSLLDQGANLEVRNWKNQTPLLVACECWEVELAECLVKGGAKVGVLDLLGRSPLYFACQKEHLRLAQLMVEAGARCCLEEGQKVGLKKEWVEWLAGRAKEVRSLRNLCMLKYRQEWGQWAAANIWKEDIPQVLKIYITVLE